MVELTVEMSRQIAGGAIQVACDGSEGAIGAVSVVWLYSRYAGGRFGYATVYCFT